MINRSAKSAIDTAVEKVEKEIRKKTATRVQFVGTRWRNKAEDRSLSLSASISRKMGDLSYYQATRESTTSTGTVTRCSVRDFTREFQRRARFAISKFTAGFNSRARAYANTVTFA